MTINSINYGTVEDLVKEWRGKSKQNRISIPYTIC